MRRICLALWCASSSDVQQMLATSRPDKFFVPPYVGHLGWIGMRLDRDLSWDEIEGVIKDAHTCRHRQDAEAARGEGARNADPAKGVTE